MGFLLALFLDGDTVGVVLVTGGTPSSGRGDREGYALKLVVPLFTI